MTSAVGAGGTGIGWYLNLRKTAKPMTALNCTEHEAHYSRQVMLRDRWQLRFRQKGRIWRREIVEDEAAGKAVHFLQSPHR